MSDVDPYGGMIAGPVLAPSNPADLEPRQLRRHHRAKEEMIEAHAFVVRPEVIGKDALLDLVWPAPTSTRALLA